MGFLKRIMCRHIWKTESKEFQDINEQITDIQNFDVTKSERFIVQKRCVKCELHRYFEEYGPTR